MPATKKPKAVKIDLSKVEYTLEIQEEHIPVRGNAMASGDDEADKETEDYIISELNDGNLWAWCVVKVTATYPGLTSIKGVDYLGACSYKDEEDFKQGGYWEDMKAEALADLLSGIDAVKAVIC